MRKAFSADSSCHTVMVQKARPSANLNLTPRPPAACHACLNERQVRHAEGNKKRNDRMRKRVAATRGIVKSSAPSVSGGCPRGFLIHTPNYAYNVSA
jgi:hypothetical protein